MAAETFYSALHWAKKAEASAQLAADLAQTEGKVIQLGFDGSIQDGQLVFKHAPGGVEVPYQLVDDVEYELDLAYNGDLDSLTTMVVKNGADTISFVSALHRSSTEPARVADMDAVMRHDIATGYRWLFKATYKIAPNGAKVFLLYPVVAAKDYSNITNCITEIPQDIKLELNNGTLTLKAGSKVYVPNGFEADGVTPKFDVVVTESDISRSSFVSHSESCLLFIIYDSDASLLLSTSPVSACTSGTTTPTNRILYSTTDNTLGYYDSSGVKTDVRTFPIASVTQSTTTITSIDQVFNGFGYIGSTAYALPNVKGLIPNGRNEDGSLRNIEVATDRVITLTKTDGYSRNDSDILLSKDGELSFTDINYEVQADGYIYNKAGTTRLSYFSIGTYTSAGDVISNLTPKTAFRAVDYNDAALKQNFKVVSTLPSSPQPDVFYFIPE